jgi:hypothetical protein
MHNPIINSIIIWGAGIVGTVGCLPPHELFGYSLDALGVG